MAARITAAALGAVVFLGAGIYLLAAGTGSPGAPETLAKRPRTFDTNDPIRRACDLDPEYLIRIWRGHDPVHSEDVTAVPQEPNFSGSFQMPSHSGPWDYLQNVPLVLYGPGHIEPLGRIADAASIVDLYPTMAKLTGTTLEERAGRALDEALVSDGKPPRLVLMVVWDGVGHNVLERWPADWPTLRRLEEGGVSYVEATIGSSPSITPAIHSSLGTGEYPRKHGVTAIRIRTRSGRMGEPFEGRRPTDLRLTTFADQIDAAFDNRSLAGMLATKTWHLGMLGHGTAAPGGDADHLALMTTEGRIVGNDDFYSTPPYLRDFPGLDEHARALDLVDGRQDGKWRGNEILENHDNPAWSDWQTDILLAMLKREGYGRDDVPDILLTNYKMTDTAGHVYGMDSEEMSATVRAQDRGLARIIDYLNEEIGDYVVVVTSDHGHTPSPGRTGGWPIQQPLAKQHIDAYFGTPPGKSLVSGTGAVGPFLDRPTLDELGVTAADVAEFLNGYRLGDNWRGSRLPQGYEDRADEHLFSAAFSKEQLPAVMRCAFGSRRPPENGG